jgi:hypothetical protein
VCISAETACCEDNSNLEALPMTKTILDSLEEAGVVNSKSQTQTFRKSPFITFSYLKK